LLSPSFLLLLPPPPLSTLFPYTTLFRSRVTLNFFPGESFSDLDQRWTRAAASRPRTTVHGVLAASLPDALARAVPRVLQIRADRSEEHTSELQSPYDLVCRLLLEKKK